MSEAEKSLSALKGKVYKYSIIAAVIIEAISLIFLGFDRQFAAGLILGTCISAINFRLHVLQILTLDFSRNRKRRGVFIRYLVRIILYAISFYLALRISYICALGALLGFMTQKIAIIVEFVFRPLFTKKEEPETPKQYNNLDEDGWPEKRHWYDYDYDPERDRKVRSRKGR
ncbi:MAG: ATP synthase subunit I [Firmicutes bacterium]|nr:ATP synthase subunit I [Bacillota bacterium]